MAIEDLLEFVLKVGVVLCLCLVVLLFIGLVIGIVAYIVMLLWNYVVPSTFGFGVLTFWKSFALVFLISILFGRIRR
jgi:uncharacterized membrane protein